MRDKLKSNIHFKRLIVVQSSERGSVSEIVAEIVDYYVVKL